MSNSAEDILSAEACEKSDADSDEVTLRPNISDHDVVDSFIGAYGSVYELKRTRPKKKSNRFGNQTTALNNARATYNFNNKGGSYVPRVSDALADTIPPSGCIRCGSDIHNWRLCHFPFQMQLAFPIKNGPIPQSINLISPVVDSSSQALLKTDSFEPTLSAAGKFCPEMHELVENAPELRSSQN